VLSTLKQDCFENVYDKWVASHWQRIAKHGKYFEKHFKKSYNVMTFMTACAGYV
jgi:hypothetical protein